MINIPRDKLPLSHHGTDRPEMGAVCDIYSKGSYEGHIKSNELTEYVVKAANELPEVINILQDVIAAFDLDAERYTDGDILDIIHLMVSKYLNKLEDEKA